MNIKATKEALEAVAEEAEKLLSMELSDAAEAKVELILSIARYQVDIRTQQETQE